MIDLNDYGFGPFRELPETPGSPARVAAVHRERYQLISGYGEIFGRLKKSAYYGKERMEFPTVGDFVKIQHCADGDSLIISTLQRRTSFSRREPGPIPRSQAVAANFDVAFLLQSLNSNFNLRRLERYLTLTYESGATPVVLLTKADLSRDASPQLSAVRQIAAGVAAFAVSATTGYGLDALTEYLKPGNTLAFLGSSGVGKSSLINALAGRSLMETGAVRQQDSRGRHTTTHRQLFLLKSGAMVIDTPGMRELGMWDVSDGLKEAFTDVEEYLGKCRFSDCRHQTEPGCAVRAAIESGKLTEERWKSYLMLKAEGHRGKKPSSPREQPASKISRKQQRKREKRIDWSED